LQKIILKDCWEPTFQVIIFNISSSRTLYQILEAVPPNLAFPELRALEIRHAPWTSEWHDAVTTSIFQIQTPRDRSAPFTTRIRLQGNFGHFLSIHGHKLAILKMRLDLHQTPDFEDWEAALISVNDV
jgi:hypothetical protein